jgi:hypothetical protein
VRPDLAPPGALAFNNSFGLPTMTMPFSRATAVLEEIQQLSKVYGTKMEIVHNLGEQQQEGGKQQGMLSQVFARVQLDPPSP